MIRRPPRSTRTEHAFPTRRSSDLEMLVSLNGRGRKPSFLKLRVSLELEKATDQARIQAVMPRIIDNFQVFLRELRIEELQGSQGLYRVKEELLARVNAAAYPTKVKDVLFKEMLEIGRAPSGLQSLMRISSAVFCLKKKRTLRTSEKTNN